MRITRLENGEFLIHVDCDLRTIAERKMYVVTDEKGRPKTPELVPIIVRIGRGQKLLEGLLSGTYKTIVEACETLGISKSQGSRIMRYASLSPVIVEGVVSGKLNLDKVNALLDQLLAIPIWTEQHKLLGIR